MRGVGQSPAAANADERPFFIQYEGDSGAVYLERRAEEANSPARPGGFGWIEVASEPSASMLPAA
jgi:hypothetical protein